MGCSKKDPVRIEVAGMRTNIQAEMRNARGAISPPCFFLPRMSRTAIEYNQRQANAISVPKIGAKIGAFSFGLTANATEPRRHGRRNTQSTRPKSIWNHRGNPSLGG